ncbi:MAG: hypothetical protein K1000chlam3_01702 [Chlamydiae bacterium]|nr:hypothetical protein [Chlamydiota bacterium]
MSVKTEFSISEPDKFRHCNKGSNFEDLSDLSKKFIQFKNEVFSSTILEERYQEFQSFKANLLENFKKASTEINWEGLATNQKQQRFIVNLNKIIAGSLNDIEDKLATTLHEKLNVLTNAILQKNQDEVGLFRISGSVSAIKELVKKIKEGQINNIQGENVHTLAGALKQILKDQSPHLLDAVKGDLLNIENPNVNEIQTALNGLKQKDQAILKTLMNFLSEIAAHSKNNKMGPRNLAICMGPNLLTITSTANPLDEIQETLKVNTLVAFMIQHSAKFFN